MIFIFSPAIIRFFASSPHPYTAYLLRVLCGAVIIVCMNIPACLILLAGDHKKNYLRIFTVGMLVCILSNLALAPFLNAKGTVLATLLTELFITAGLYWEVYRLYQVASPAGNLNTHTIDNGQR